MSLQLGVRPNLLGSWVTAGPRTVMRFFRTLRHLRAGQIFHLVFHRLRPARRSSGPVNPRGAMPHCQDIAYDPPGTAADDFRDGFLTLLNRSQAVGFPPDWCPAGVSRLWLYHLHYHEFIEGLEFEQARQIVLDWIGSHRPGSGRVGWEPYPLSLRLSVWCTTFLCTHRSRTLSDTRFRDLLWASLAEQADYLCARPERHLLGNHLLENGAALTLVGSMFDHPSARTWLAAGRCILKRELPEQILSDGGHCERSPMYQARVLNVLRLLETAGTAEVRSLVSPCTVRLASATAALTHPDGGIALLNDSALGVVPTPLAPDGGPPGGPFALTDSGYYGARTGAGHYVVCDAGPLGPDYQPGHGHADLFSFELSLYGTRVIVDSGVATYERGSLRDYCRSTRAHNTVEIEGQDQAELWQAFRVGRRCRPEAVAWRQDGEGFELSGHHTGYRHLSGHPTHTRGFRWNPEGRLEIVDHIDARRPVKAVARLHLHPDCRIVSLDAEKCLLQFPGGAATVRWSGWTPVASVAESLYCPEFGRTEANRCLELSATGAQTSGTTQIEAA